MPAGSRSPSWPRWISPARSSAETLAAGVQRANERLLSEGRQDPERFGMGTTVTGLAAVGPDQWALFNVGDSRSYRFVDGRLEQLSVDHSAVQELVDAGLLDPVARPAPSAPQHRHPLAGHPSRSPARTSGSAPAVAGRTLSDLLRRPDQ